MIVLNGARGGAAALTARPVIEIQNNGTAKFRITATGDVVIPPVAFSSLPTCVSGLEGARRSVNDAMTNAWGDTITGSGSLHVLAYCNGSNWTVYAK